MDNHHVSKFKFPPGAYTDNGRRGLPLIGCDCVGCFGYCLIDPEIVLRERRKEADTPKEESQ